MPGPTKQQLKNRKEWLEALESGKFNQRAGGLYRHAISIDQNGGWPALKAGYCCLGVAAKVAGVKKTKNNNFVFPQYEHNGITPNAWIEERFGLTQRQAKKVIDTGIEMNDIKRLDFSAIAAEMRKIFKQADARRRAAK